jgi:formylglycine-generating enzyme required for sulfatase activity/transposase-like protein
MATPPAEFTDHQKSVLVQRIIAGSLTLRQACVQYGLSPNQLKEWVHLFRRAVRQALDHQLRDTLSVQGLELDDQARPPEFSGDLSDIGVGDLLQTIQMGRKDAHITVSHGGEASEIWCRGGEVVDARSGQLRGARAFYRIFAVERGSIIADFAPNDRDCRIELSTPRLLLEAARSSGLRARLMQRVGDPTLVFRVATSVTERHVARLEQDERDVLRLFDGLRSVEEIVLSSGLPDARALDIVAHFRERNLLVPSTSLVVALPVLDSAPPSANITMSYQPSVAGAASEPARLPAWMLASGAVLCSSLGAISAIAYANSLSPSAIDLSPATAAARAEPPRTEPARSAPAPLGSATSTTIQASISSSRDASAVRRCPKPMVWIEGGEFSMGSDSNRPALSLARPQHRVSVRGFCLGVHEVTVAEYADCTDAGDCTPAHRAAYFAAEAGEEGAAAAAVELHGAMCNVDKPDRQEHPVNCVSHAQAESYCRARGSRLPSEAEWEFAARGTDTRPFPWGSAAPTRDHVNACGKECERWHLQHEHGDEIHGLMYPVDDGYSGTAPVGYFPLGSTPEGVEDMIGNVFEWTAQGLYEYGSAARVDPRGPIDSDSFVIRGGNFNSGLREFADPALRFAMHRESYSHGVGFRCAVELSDLDP